MNIEIPKKSANYLEHTKHGYEITEPDSEGDLMLEESTEREFRAYLSKEDLILMLSRFNPWQSIDNLLSYYYENNKI